MPDSPVGRSVASLEDAADAVLEALERVEIVAESGDMEDLDAARLDLRFALANHATATQGKANHA